MYQHHFGLAENPFSIAPDPRYLYMSERHQEALAHLLYGVQCDGGFVLLTGEVGTGKTTVCRCLLEQLPAKVDVAFIYNPKLTAAELLSTLCTELHIVHRPETQSIKVLTDLINAHLLDAHARGRKTLLIIDEAQNLDAGVLEQMRLLTNLETNERKLLQIVLVGQPELRELLARAELRQLAQRVTARYHLGALSGREVAGYVKHRLQVAGATRLIFPPGLARRLHRLSGGVPRLINVICDRALLGAYTQGKERVDRATLDTSAREVFGGEPASRRVAWATAAALGLAGAGVAAGVMLYQRSEVPVPVHSAAQRAAVAAPTPTREAAPILDPHSNAADSRAPLGAAATLPWDSLPARPAGEAAAWAALFRRWAVEYGAEQGPPCAFAARHGLACLAGRGGLEELRQVDLPAVLTLRDRRGAERPAALVALDAGTAGFAVADGVRRVAASALAGAWTGDYTLLWRTPPEYRAPLGAGATGPAAAWLAQRLQPDAPPAPRLGEAHLARLKEFQLARGLVPDGVAGPQTLIRLAAGEPDTPHLKDARP